MLVSGFRGSAFLGGYIEMAKDLVGMDYRNG
jgi:hypothetical protein